MTGALPTPSPLTELRPGMLMAFKAGHPVYDKLIVSKSPHVRVTDEMFEPVREEVIDKCVFPETRQVIKDPGFRFGVQQFYAMDVYCECPGGGKHWCKVSADDIFSLFAAN